ncbi:MAG: polysaccharide deacetylase family protein [Patescibacteria group bacterium]|jgi:chitin deacetylase
MKINIRIYIICALVLAVLAITAYGLFELSKSRTFQFFGRLASHADTDKKVVALTFDDAPTEYTDEVLKILRENNVQATFYAIGQSLEKFPNQAKEIVRQGSELGNHSYSHRRLILKSQAFIKSEIEKTNQLIRDSGYQGEITFRPPNGKKLLGLPRYLNENNIKTIMWDIEPDTNYSGNAELITKNTLLNAKPGSIILLHPFCEKECAADREALPKIISGLKEKGYVFATISELLKY